MIRAYHDPALLRPISRDRSWLAALELPAGPQHYREKRVYIHNPDPATVTLTLSHTNADASFDISIPATHSATTGVTSFLIRSTVRPAAPLPSLTDFAVTAAGFRLEVTAFALPVADERFGRQDVGPLRDVNALTRYVASGMGFVDQEYQDSMVVFMVDRLYDDAIWALNKHYLYNPLYCPMRLVKARANSMGYDPPGVPGLPPQVRRFVYSQAFRLARATGSQEGVLSIFRAVGVQLMGVDVWREDFTWFVRVPQWVLGQFSSALLAVLALYHVDAYCIVNFGVQGDTLGNDYYDIRYTGDGIAPIGPGANFLLLESGDIILLESGSKVIIE